MQVVWNAKACYGCKMCQLVCSFHHREVFSTEFSSIYVSKSMRTGKIELSIDPSCDSCKGEVYPLCEKYCLYGALKEIK